MLAWAPGSIFTIIFFMACFVVNCNVVKKAVWASEALSVSKVHSLGSIEVFKSVWDQFNAVLAVPVWSGSLLSSERSMGMVS